jgi:glycosyltransferase involved in cell wall biosynthesis
VKFIIEALGLTAGGGKQLARDLVSHLPADAGHRFVLLLPEEAEHDALSGSHLKLIICPKPRSLAGRYHFLNHVVPALCRRERASALLCLGNFAPRSPLIPAAVLVHNAHLVCRDRAAEPRMTLRERLTRAYGRYALCRLHPGVHVVVQTPLMRDRLMREFRLHRGRISIIPNACDVTPGGIRHGVAVRRPFRFLCLTEYYTHKNLEVLPQALAMLPALTRERAQVMITVTPGQHPAAQKLLEGIERRGLEYQVVNLGPVSSEDLPAVYPACDALVLPTLLESFSRTYLEAMHFGIPILTSDRDFARSVCGEAALYFDPLDAGSVAHSMARMMTDGGLRARLVGEGGRRIQNFASWDEIAGRFVEVLERLVRESQALSENVTRRDAVLV